MTLNLDSIYLHEIKGNNFSSDQAYEWALLFLEKGYPEVSVISPNKAKEELCYKLEVHYLKSLVIQNA